MTKPLADIMATHLLQVPFYIVIPMAIVVVLFFRYVSNRADDEYGEWERFKKENKCELIEVDSSRFFGTVYTWKTEDGKIIKNNYDK